MLFHDVMAKIQDFGAWKFFEEVQETAEETFRFDHGFGLGVLRKPGGDRSEDHPLLKLLFSSSELDKQRLKQFYVHAAHFLEARRQASRFKAMPGNKTKKGGQGKDSNDQ